MGVKGRQPEAHRNDRGQSVVSLKIGALVTRPHHLSVLLCKKVSASGKDNRFIAQAFLVDDFGI